MIPSFGGPASLKGVAGLELALLLWWWSDNMFRPAPLWKKLGLWRPQSYGQLPPLDVTPGRGPHLSERLSQPALFDEDTPADPSVVAFDEVADLYAEMVSPYSRPILDAALKRIQPRLHPAARVLDPSAGPGREAVEIARRVPDGEVVAADLSRGMVTHAHNYAQSQRQRNMAFVQADVANPPEMFWGSFDAVFSLLAFHHYPDGVAAAAGLRRALRPGGEAFIVDLGTDWARAIAWPIAKRLDPGFIQHRNGAQFRALFTAAGFQSVYWEEILPGMGLTIASA